MNIDIEMKSRRAFYNLSVLWLLVIIGRIQMLAWVDPSGANETKMKERMWNKRVFHQLWWSKSMAKNTLVEYDSDQPDGILILGSCANFTGRPERGQRNRSEYRLILSKLNSLFTPFWKTAIELFSQCLRIINVKYVLFSIQQKRYILISISWVARGGRGNC